MLVGKSKFRVPEVLLVFAAVCLLSALLPGIVYSIFLLLALPFPKAAAIFSLVLILFLLRRNLKATLASFFCIVAILVGFAQTHDFTFDGQMYHGAAILYLLEGWNPVWDQELNTLSQAQTDGFPAFTQINTYPKVTWYCAAVLAAWFNNPEAGKALSLLLALGAFVFVSSTLANLGLSRFFAPLFALTLVVTPVVAVQFFTFMVDGVVAICCVLALSLVADLLQNKSKFKEALLFILAAFFLNSKHTSAFLCFCIGILLLGISLRFRRDQRWARIRNLWLGGALFGIFVVGFNPFVTNTFRHGNPLYPALGGGGSEWKKKAEAYYPKDTLRALRMLNLSLFSSSVNIYPEDLKEPRYKYPFVFSRGEIGTFAVPDTMLGGFGPFYTGMVIVAFLLGVIGNFWSKTRKSFLWPAVLSGFLFLTLLPSLPALWWARLVPQFWILPFLWVLPVVFQRHEFFPRFMGGIFVGVALVNLSVVFPINVLNQLNLERTFKAEMSLLRTPSLKEPIGVIFRDPRVNRYWLERSGVAYKELTEPCAKPYGLTNGFGLTTLCPVESAGFDDELWRKTQALGDPATVAQRLFQNSYYRSLEGLSSILFR